MRSFSPLEQVMSRTHGNGGNRKECTTTDSCRIMAVPAVTASIRPENGEKLRPLVPRLRTPLPMPFVVFLAVQAAFFGCVAWTRISHTGLQMASASGSDSGGAALRLADSNTIGSGLGPTLGQKFYVHHGSADVQLRNRVNAKERSVSRMLPEGTSQTVTAISSYGSTNASTALSPPIPILGTAHDPVGPTTVEEIHPPALSEVLGASAGYGKVPGWAIDTPVQMPGEALRISSGITGGQIVHQVTPVYPALARTQGIEGAVLLEATIAEDGTVSHVTVLGGPSPLAEVAQGAVQQWRYTPFELNGRPVPIRKQITIKFTLRN